MRSIFALAATTTLASAQQNWGQRLGCAVPVVKKQFDCGRAPEPLPTIKQLAQEPQRCGCPMPAPLPVRDPCPQRRADPIPPPPVTPISTGCGCQPVVREPAPVSCDVPVVREPQEVCEDIPITKQRQVMKECKKVVMTREERTRTTQVPTTTYKTVMKPRTRTVYKTVNKMVQKTRMVRKVTFEEKKVCRPGAPIQREPVAAPSCGCRQPAPVRQPACGCPRYADGRALQSCSCPQAPVQQPQCGCSAPAREPVQMNEPLCDIQKIEKVIMVPETYEENCPTKEAVIENYEEPCRVPSTSFAPKIEKYWVNCPKTVTEQCPSLENYTVTEKKCRTIAQEPLPVPEVVREPQQCNQCGCCQPARQQQNMCGSCNSVAQPAFAQAQPFVVQPSFLNEQEEWSGAGSTTNGWQLAP